jgi:hypothetical protein
MTVKELYERLGADYNDAMERVFDEDLLKMLCGMFLEDKSYSTLSEALSKQDYPAAFFDQSFRKTSGSAPRR